MLKIDMNIVDNELNVKLDGNLDGSSFEEFDKQLTSKRDEVNRIVIDATNLDYVSSAGLRVIMSTELYMRNNGKETTKVINISEDVREIFELCGFDDIVDMD